MTRRNMLMAAAAVMLTATMAATAGPTTVCNGNAPTTVSCKQPAAVQKGMKIPVWKVEYCVTGPANGPYTKISCQNPQAVHTGPFGKPATCFVGTDGKVHWATPANVREGRRFINHLYKGHWYIDWRN